MSITVSEERQSANLWSLSFTAALLSLENIHPASVLTACNNTSALKGPAPLPALPQLGDGDLKQKAVKAADE